MRKIKSLIILSVAAILVLFTFFNLHITGINKIEGEYWKEVYAGGFYVSLPPSWKYIKEQGIDSNVGKFKGDGAELSFDFGWYSSPLDSYFEPEYAITSENISGYDAKIVTPKKIGQGLTGIYIEIPNEESKDSGKNEPFYFVNPTNKLTVYGKNLNQEQTETVLKIFRSIRV